MMEELIFPEKEMLITWQRWYLLEILKQNGYVLEDDDQVLMVDADAFINPNCPNFFSLTEMKFTTVLTEGDYEWVARNIKSYSRAFFNEDWGCEVYNYFQCCFIIVNKKHEALLKSLTDYYWQNKDKIIESYNVIRTGTDQGLINILVHKSGVDMKILPREYSLIDMHRKNLLYTHPNHWWGDNLENLYHSAHVYQINAIPGDPYQNPLKRFREYWAKRFYDELLNK
jgi:hypothetical protein